MFYILLFLIAVFCISGAAAESTCGISPSLERYRTFNPNRIFGGENSNEGDFPWYIWMYADGNGCSGSIIHEKWILTAAHCVYRIKSATIYYGSVVWEIMKKKSIKPLQFFVHPEYMPSMNDIALIELNETLEFSEFVQPVCLDHNVDPYPDEIVTQCGMGNDFKKKLPGIHNITRFNHFTLQDSPIQYKDSSFCGSDEKQVICVGGINHAALTGDSGGPLMAIRDNRWVQIGITSSGRWEDFENESISIRLKNFYMRISYYCNWIKETTKNDVHC